MRKTRKVINFLLSCIAVILILIFLLPIILWFRAYKGDPLNGD